MTASAIVCPISVYIFRTGSNPKPCRIFVYRFRTQRTRPFTLSPRGSVDFLQESDGCRSCGGQQPVAEIVPNTQPIHSLRSLVGCSAGLRASSDSLRSSLSARITKRPRISHQPSRLRLAGMGCESLSSHSGCPRGRISTSSLLRESHCNRAFCRANNRYTLWRVETIA